MSNLILPKVDYHTHTPLCGHAHGQPQEYVRRAIEVGLQEIGFSDHAPLVAYQDPRYTMSFEQLPVYHQMMRGVKEQFSDFTIKVGIEADYIPGFEDKTSEMLKGYDYDFVIGSIHFIDAWAFDDPDQQIKWKHKDIDRVYLDYYELLRKSASCGLFDIIGHADLVKKFGHKPHSDLSDDIEKTAKVFKQNNVCVEINTSGIRKPVAEIYPGLEALKIYRRAGVPITFSSDAHDPMDVGRDYDKAVLWAKEAGYREYLVFKNRSIQRTENI